MSGARASGVEFRVELDGGTVVGDDTGGPGTPAVLLHPGWGDSSIWAPVAGLLPGTTRLVRYDVRGYGRSPTPTGPFTPVADLAAVLDQLAIADAVLVGHSGGGATAIGLALAQPERVRALVLAAPGVGDFPWPDDPYFAEYERLSDAGDRHGLVALGLRTWARAGSDPEAEDQIRRGVDAMLRQGEHEQGDPPAFDRLGELPMPVHVVIGALDHPMVVDCATAVASAAPHGRLTRLPGADHMLPLRAPGLLARMVADVLAP